MIDDPSGDQTHHYAAFQSAGINDQTEAAIAHQFFNDVLMERNAADVRLGDAAYDIGAALRSDPNKLFIVRDLISKAVCAH